MRTLPLIAQEFSGAPLAPPATNQQSAIFWLAVILVVVIVGFFLIMLMRRWLKEPLVASQDTGFSLSELRAMRDRGEITPEEYELTRSRVIAKTKENADKKSPPKRGDEE